MEKMNKDWLNHYDAHVPEFVDFPHISLPKFFERAAKKYQDRVFIDFKGNEFPYGEIFRQALNLSFNLRALGVEKGDRIGLMLPNIPQFVLCYYGILMAGGIVTAINPAYTIKEVETLSLQSGISVLICMDERAGELSGLVESVGIRNLVTTKIEDYKLIQQATGRKIDPGNNLNLVDLLNWSVKMDTNLGELHIDPRDPAIFQFSGGTTGIPKPAMGSHRNIIANIHQFSVWCDLQEEKVVILTAIPLYHVYGMVLGMNIALTVGAKIILIHNPRDIDHILDEIEAKKVSFYPGVPTMYHAININQSVLKKKYRLNSIKACISGSFTLHPTIKESFEKITGGRLMEGYGLSEAPTATHCNPLFGKNKTGSIGLPLPCVEAKIVDVDDHTLEIDIGEIGELALRGPQVMLGYFNLPAATAETIKDDWLLTGDIAYRDEDGYFFLVDRKKISLK